METRVDNIEAGKHLGQKSQYSHTYDPSLLVAVPRLPNREKIGYDNEIVPWKYGWDVWNCYEIYFINEKTGYPITGVAKIVYPSNSECIVESKSLKLYLNSLNNTTSTVNKITEIITRDLIKLLNVDVIVNISVRNGNCCSEGHYYERLDSYLAKIILLDNIDIHTGEYVGNKYTGNLRLVSDALFSRCQITNQPDHGKLIIDVESDNGIYIDQMEDFSKWIFSLKDENCFHEPTVEKIYNQIYHSWEFDHLCVTALYTRRGGISIAPLRSNSMKLIPNNIINPYIQHVKSLRE